MVHIKWPQYGGPDGVNNGLALCSLQGRLFDAGAFTLIPYQKCKGNYPNRVATRTWSPDALNPTTMFRKLICKVRDKLNKGQPSFVPGKHYNILLVDISYLGYADAFQNSFYLRQFGKIAQGCLSDRFDLFDCVVFFL